MVLPFDLSGTNRPTTYVPVQTRRSALRRRRRLFRHRRLNRLPEYRLLPENIEPGEVLALLNCGAYSLAQASQYNGRFLPAVILIRENGEVELIRKRDDFGDLVVNDVF